MDERREKLIQRILKLDDVAQEYLLELLIKPGTKSQTGDQQEKAVPLIFTMTEEQFKEGFKQFRRQREGA